MKKPFSSLRVATIAKTLGENIVSPPWQIRIVEIVGGLTLARYGDLPFAIVGGFAFLHGITASRYTYKNGIGSKGQLQM